MQTKTIHSSARGMIELVRGEETFIRRTVYSENTVYNALKFHKSPYLPKIYSVEVTDGKTIVCEEYVDGKPPVCSELSAKKAEKIMIQLCSALEAIHKLGIVHRDDMIFFCEDKSAKILLASGKELYGKFEKYLMHTDLDGDGLAEMATVCVDINGRLDIEIYTGKIVDGNQLGIGCYEFIVPFEFDEELLGKDTFVQLTEFELDGDGLLAVTIGDKESYNFTGFFTVIDDWPTCLGSAWGETYARVVGTSLSEYFKGGGNNLYSYYNGKLRAVTSYDYAEYSSINYAPAPLEDIYDFYS